MWGAAEKGLVGSTLALESIGHGFESEHRLFSHHVASAFSKLRSLAKCSLDDSMSEWAHTAAPERLASLTTELARQTKQIQSINQSINV